MKIKVNLIENIKREKPNKKEYGKIQKTICNDENIKELDFDTFVELVGNQGALWKSSFMIGGAKNINYKCAYMLSLDFDNGLSINDFLKHSKDLGLEPTFIYETYSSTKDFNRFRAIWRLKEPIELPQLKNALQLMLMEVFEGCDEACKDLSRLWVGGKNISFYKSWNVLNIDNLLNALINVIDKKATANNFTRDMKAFCKKIGINIYNKMPFILKSPKSDVICEEHYNIYYREVRKKHQILDIYKYDNLEFSFTNSYNLDKNKNVSSKVQSIKGEKPKRIKIDFERLSTKCELFGDFLKGDILSHKEIQHISFNLYDCEGYPTLLKDTLVSNSYNNWENKYNTYVSAVNYNYLPTSCNTYCKYCQTCGSPKNIKDKYYQREGKAKKIFDIPTITLEEAEKKLREIPSIIKNITKDDFLAFCGVVGVGKTELFIDMDLSNTMIGVTNHKLGEELYQRLSVRTDLNLLYVKPLELKNMPEELKKTINDYYDFGIVGEVKTLVFDEIKRLNQLNREKGEAYPIYYKDLIEYVTQLSKIPKASTLLFTHHRISFGNHSSKVDTIILDEDFLRTFINYGSYETDILLKDLKNLRAWLSKFDRKNSKYYDDYLELLQYFTEFYDCVDECSGKWIKNPLKNISLNPKFVRMIINYIKENINKLDTNMFKLLNAEAISIEENGYIHTINGEAIKELEGYKIVCMSATLDEKIHTSFIKRYLPNKNIIYKTIENTELKGNIYCNCSYAWSREGLKALTSKSSKELERILNSDKYTNIITFKDNKLLDVSNYNKSKITHFGACEGLDRYKGQDLCVIGTPHTNCKIYEGYYFLLTENNPVSETWRVKRVQKYGYEFDLNTYESEFDSFLTDIQLYFVYSELIQAVGRARALRMNVNVYVYSALPLPNSIFM